MQNKCSDGRVSLFLSRWKRPTVDDHVWTLKVYYILESNMSSVLLKFFDILEFPVFLESFEKLCKQIGDQNELEMQFKWLSM